MSIFSACERFNNLRRQQALKCIPSTTFYDKCRLWNNSGGKNNQYVAGLLFFWSHIFGLIVFLSHKFDIKYKCPITLKTFPNL